MNENGLSRAVGAVVGLVRILLLIAATSAFSTVLGASADEDGMVEKLRRFEKLSAEQRVALLEASNENQKAIRTLLLKQLAATNIEAKCFAAYLLGQHRFAEAADSLAALITLRAEVRSNPREWLWDLYPAMEALIKIGGSSIPATLRNLEESDDPKVRELSLKVVYHAEKKDKDIIQLRFNKALAKQDDPQKRVRLKLAIESLLDVRFGG